MRTPRLAKALAPLAALLGAPLLALPLLLLLCLSPPAPAAAEELLDGVAAQVGSEIVLVSEVRQLAEPAVEEMRRSGASEAELRALRAEVLDRLIERALLRQVVRRAELGASEEEVTRAVEDIARENGLGLEELRASVEAQGMPFDLYRERIRAEIEQAKVVNGMVGARVQVSEDEVRELFEERYGDQPQGGTTVHLRHILLPFRGEGEAAREEACERAERALARIRGGEPFAEVAREVSASGAEEGGDIGWFHADTLAGWMRAAVEELEEGETSEVLRTDFGCNLLQVAERRAYEPRTFEEMRSELQDVVYRRKLRKEYADFLEELRDRTYIDRKGLYAEAAPSGADPERVPAAGLPETVLEDEGF